MVVLFWILILVHFGRCLLHVISRATCILEKHFFHCLTYEILLMSLWQNEYVTSLSSLCALHEIETPLNHNNVLLLLFVLIKKKIEDLTIILINYNIAVNFVKMLSSTLLFNFVSWKNLQGQLFLLLEFVVLLVVSVPTFSVFQLHSHLPVAVAPERIMTIQFTWVWQFKG